MLEAVLLNGTDPQTAVTAAATQMKAVMTTAGYPQS